MMIRMRECRYKSWPKGISTGRNEFGVVARSVGRDQGVLSLSFFNLQDHQTHLQRHSTSIYHPKTHELCLLIQSRFVCERRPR